MAFILAWDDIEPVSENEVPIHESVLSKNNTGASHQRFTSKASDAHSVIVCTDPRPIVVSHRVIYPQLSACNTSEAWRGCAF